uniref:Uncharacterized protein n=1 Tax=Romanomermis culicivorax TaxID=13658 RepID=A0A915HN08_ROMCU
MWDYCYHKYIANISRANVQPPKWVDNCGKPDPCVSLTADKYLRQIIYTPDGKLQPAEDLLKLATAGSFPPCDGWKDGRIRVRFLRCIFDYRHGGQFCNGSSVRFELFEKCDVSKRLPTDLYYDYEHCGNLANYHYTDGCQVYCIKSHNNLPFHQKTDGRLCQPSPRRFAPFHDQTPDVPPDGGRYMCFKSVCVKVVDKDESIIDGGCETPKVAAQPF